VCWCSIPIFTDGLKPGGGSRNHQQVSRPCCRSPPGRGCPDKRNGQSQLTTRKVGSEVVTPGVPASILTPLTPIPARTPDVCFSNRPSGVKHFQTIHLCGVDVTRGLVLLFGIATWGPSSMGSEDEAEQSFGRPCRQCQTAGPSGHTNSPHPSSREGHLSTARWSASFLLSGLILNCFMLLLPRLSPGSTGTLCRQPRCGA
jgi:hypothetical protein